MKNKNSQMIKSKVDNNAQNRRDYDDKPATYFFIHNMYNNIKNLICI